MMSLSPKVNLFNSADWYSLAKWFFDTKPALSSQCLRRTIIGRAYYAAFICARDATGSKAVGQGGHENVVRALSAKNSNAANKLNSLRVKRQSADYVLDKDISVRDVEVSLLDSRTVLIALGKMPLDVPPHNQPYSQDYLDGSKFLANKNQT